MYYTFIIDFVKKWIKKPQHYNVQNKQLINVVLYCINKCTFEGIVHSKMKTLSLITHAHIVPNP